MNTNISRVVVLAFALGSFLIAGAWTSAPSNPPSNNVAAPLNVGTDPQTKPGTLDIRGLVVRNRQAIANNGVYALPSNLALGVNGSVGASQYCDQNGQNCVSTIGGGSTSGSSAGGQILPGWPNGIVCNATNGTKIVLDLQGYFPQGRTRYTDKPGYIYGEIGDVVSMYFDAVTKETLVVHGNSDYGGNVVNDFAGCFTVGRSINDPMFTWY